MISRIALGLEMKRRALMAAVTLVVLAIMLFGLFFAVSYYRRALQVRTFADMEFISRHVEMMVARYQLNAEKVSRVAAVLKLIAHAEGQGQSPSLAGLYRS